MKYLLDTNVISEPLRPTPNPGIIEKLQAREGETAIPAPVWHELRFGCSRLPHSKRRETIERYLETVVLPTISVLEYDREAADWHGSERARLAARGLPPPYVDGQIAAIAYVRNLVLITFNRMDFERFQGIRIEDWAANR